MIANRIKRILFIISVIILAGFLLWLSFFFVLAIFVLAGLIMLYEKLFGKLVFIKMRKIFVRKKREGDTIIEAEYQIIDKNTDNKSN